jgi:hypothetical protein
MFGTMYSQCAEDDDEYEKVDLESQEDDLVDQIKTILYQTGISNDEKLRRVIRLL